MKRLPSSDANHNDVTSMSSAVCSGSVCSVVDTRDCEANSRQKENPLVAGDCCESLPSTNHSDLGYASDVDCDACSVRNRLHSGVSRAAESEHSISSGCCSPSSAVISEGKLCS